MDKYTTNDVVNFALTAKPVEFKDAVHQILAHKLQDAVEQKKEQVARETFGAAEEDEEESSEVETEDQEEIENTEE